MHLLNVGFQSQPYGNTIQDQIEHRLNNFFKRRVGIVAWGRTDAGVHAKGAVVTIDLTDEEVTRLCQRSKGNSCNVEAAARILLQVLKQFACNTGVSGREGKARFGSISALNVTPVPMDFDARYSALWKRYVYFICSGDGDSAQSLPFAWMCHAWRLNDDLDLDAMTKAVKLLDGKEHNYEWLSVVQEGEFREPHRTVHLTIEEVMLTTIRSDVPYFLQYDNSIQLYKITATSDFFLYKMVRRIVGLLVSIGRGKATLNSLTSCIEAQDNSRREKIVSIPKELVETAPAHGLCLDHIEYNIPL